jgi:type II secretory pathway predicted ATPase ExeA
MDAGSYRDGDVEALAEEVLYIIKRKRLGLICVDEAGLMTVDGISALALVLDMAKQQNYHLTIILIGMDNLPLKMDERTRPQLYRRVHQWCNFKDYDIEDSYNLISGLHPHFNSLDRTIPDQWDQVRIVHELTGGLPGLIVQFLARFDGTYKKMPHLITTDLLRGIHIQNVNEYKEIMASTNGTALSASKFPRNKKPRNEKNN